MGDNKHCDAIQSHNGKDWWSAQMQCYDNKFTDIWANFCWMEKGDWTACILEEKVGQGQCPNFQNYHNRRGQNKCADDLDGGNPRKRTLKAIRRKTSGEDMCTNPADYNKKLKKGR